MKKSGLKPNSRKGKQSIVPALTMIAIGLLVAESILIAPIVDNIIKREHSYGFNFGIIFIIVAAYPLIFFGSVAYGNRRSHKKGAAILLFTTAIIILTFITSLI